MLEMNRLKRKLGDGQAVLGVWNTLASPLVTEVLAQAGLDFQIIDLEHGPFALDQVNLHVSACENSMTCTPLVRIPTNSEWMALQALDQGAHGVVVPHIDTVEAAKKLVNATKYFPEGERGFTPFSKAGGFTNKSVASYIKRAISETLNVVIVESKEGLENLEEIVEVDNVDIVYFGAYDLSQALGYPGEVWNHNVVTEIQKAVEVVNQSGKYAGGFVPQKVEDMKMVLDMGMKFITYEVDSSILHTNVQTVADWFMKEVDR